MEKCCNKTTHRTEEEKKIINNRINRIEGQLKGIKKMVNEDTYCNDILIQLSAIENSVKSLSNHILENHKRFRSWKFRHRRRTHRFIQKI